MLLSYISANPKPEKRNWTRIARITQINKKRKVFCDISPYTTHKLLVVLNLRRLCKPAFRSFIRVYP
jgi:hypothetical protein